MTETTDVAMVSVAALARVVTDPTALRVLVHALPAHERRRHQGHDVSHQLRMGAMGSDNDHDVPRARVQKWLNDGQLTLCDEPSPGSRLGQLRGSPSTFLQANGLTEPRKK